jgi:Tfp pilus assembly protein FimT
MNNRNRDAGFTKAELMMVLGMLGAAAIAAGPSFGRSSPGKAHGYAEEVAQELQRARMEAVTTRVPRYAFIYSNRIEIRAGKRGASRSAGLVAPTTDDPVLRTVRARSGLSIWDVARKPGLPSEVLSLTTSKMVVFGTHGAGFIGPSAPTNPAPVYIYINNDRVKSNHPEATFRVDIAPRSGEVALRSSW